MPTTPAKDLRIAVPRSPFDTIAGIPWLPRLLDKLRAAEAGTLGDYTPFPSGGDQGFLSAMGLDAEALRARIATASSDAAIAAWVLAHARPGWERRIAEFRAAYCETIHPEGSEMAGFLRHALADLAAERPDLDLSPVRTLGDMLCVEEGHPLPARA